MSTLDWVYGRRNNPVKGADCSAGGIVLQSPATTAISSQTDRTRHGTTLRRVAGLVNPVTREEDIP
jgi:hypothetical protein